MGVMFMDKTDVHINEAMKWIKFVLMKNYRMKAKDAEKAIIESGIRNLYGEDIEMSSHTPIEQWAKLVYAHWKKENQTKGKQT